MTPQEKDQLNKLEKMLNDFFYKYNRENYLNRIELNRTLVLKDVENKTEFENFAGLRLGHSTSKIGLFGNTPVVKAPAISAVISQGATYSQSDVQSIVNAVNQIKTALSNIGITT